jgi:hypothetical protein
MAITPLKPSSYFAFTWYSISERFLWILSSRRVEVSMVPTQILFSSFSEFTWPG